MERFPAIEPEVEVPEEEQVLSIGLAYNVQGKPISDLVVQIALDREAQFTEASALNSVAKALVGPTDEYIVFVTLAGTQIGTITWAAAATDGVVAFTETMGAPGQVVSLVFPTAVDDTFTDPAITLQANRGAEPGTEPGEVVSFNSRTGVITSQLGDYADSMIENTSSVAGATVQEALDALLAGDPVAFRALMDNYQQQITLIDQANIEFPLGVGVNFDVTLAGNRTLDNPTDAASGQRGVLIVHQDATGGRTLAYDTLYIFPGGTPPVLTATANATDALYYYVSDSGFILMTFEADFS
jgi:hypothetical protein